MRIERYLVAVIERHGLKNDTELASMIGVEQSAVSQYRTGARTPDNDACLRVAQALRMDDPVPVIMAADIDRAERAGKRSLWEAFSKRPALRTADAAAVIMPGDESGQTDIVVAVAGRRAPTFGLPEAVQALDQALRGGVDERLPPLKRLAHRIHDVNPYPDSPAREILALFGDRWSSLLMAVLATGYYRHAELHRIMNIASRLSQESEISQRMLTLRLRALERDGLVSRSVGEGNAPAVEYELTPLGISLVEKLEGLIDWTVDHANAISQVQQAFDERDIAPIGTTRHRLR